MARNECVYCGEVTTNATAHWAKSCRSAPPKVKKQSQREVGAFGEAAFEVRVTDEARRRSPKPEPAPGVPPTPPPAAKTPDQPVKRTTARRPAKPPF